MIREEDIWALLRSDPGDLAAFLFEVRCHVTLPGTRTKVHCYHLALDGNGRPRVPDFAKFLAYRMVDFAIPRTEVMRAHDADRRHGNSVASTELVQRARGLFTRLPNSGEGGELMLSVLAETLLRLPQLFTKMVLKTSSDMHVHGSDGIHVGVTPQGKLAMYWGESKLYKDANAAIRKCFESLAPFLTADGGSRGAPERELQLMRDGLQLNDPNLVTAMKHYLDPADPSFLRMEYRGLALVGNSCDSYPTQPNQATAEEVKSAILKYLPDRHQTIGMQVADQLLTSFEIELLYLPFPDVTAFRRAFRSELGVPSNMDRDDEEESK